MKKEDLCVAARAALGDHICQLYLRVVGDLPGNLWAWKVYVDGNIHERGPGSTRKDPRPWYATLLQGKHRIVLREPDHSKPDRIESNTLHFHVDKEDEMVVLIEYADGKPLLKLEQGN